MTESYSNGKLCCWHFENSVYVIWESTTSRQRLRRSPTFQYCDEQWQIEALASSDIYAPNACNYLSIRNCTGLISSRKRTAFLLQLCYIRNNEVVTKMEKVQDFYQNQWKCDFQKIVDKPTVNFTVWCRIFCTENKTHRSDEKELQTECSNAGLHALSDDLKAAVDTGTHSDVVLKLREVTFPAHKVILSCRSKVFQAMFHHDCRENLDNAVDLVDMDVAVAKLMLQYIYTGKVAELSSDNAIKLYSVADRYCLTELVTQCREFMVGHVHVDNVCEMAAAADLHSDDALMKAVQAFFGANLVEILQSEKQKVLSENNPQLVLKLVQEAVLRNQKNGNYKCSCYCQGLKRKYAPARK